jgi:hypothetical protein
VCRRAQQIRAAHRQAVRAFESAGGTRLPKVVAAVAVLGQAAQEALRRAARQAREATPATAAEAAAAAAPAARAEAAEAARKAARKAERSSRTRAMAPPAHALPPLPSDDPSSSRPADSVVYLQVVHQLPDMDLGNSNNNNNNNNNNHNRGGVSRTEVHLEAYKLPTNDDDREIEQVRVRE